MESGGFIILTEHICLLWRGFILFGCIIIDLLKHPKSFLLSAFASLNNYLIHVWLIRLLVCRDAFIKYWIDGNILTMDTETKIFEILRQPGCKFLTQVCFSNYSSVPTCSCMPTFTLLFSSSIYVFIYGTRAQIDFKPVLLELLSTHPGLEFLQSTPEFQERYGMFAIILLTASW